LNAAESQKVYDRYQIPGSGRILWDGALSLLNPNASSKVHYRNNDRAPLLFIGGGQRSPGASRYQQGERKKST